MPLLVLISHLPDGKKYSSEISETLTLDVSEIKLGEPREIYYWSKDFQNPQNNLGHISTSIN